MQQTIGIFGYGSLISADSRARTAPSGGFKAIELEGFRRQFSILDKDAKMASVVICAAPKAKCNGVMFDVDASELAEFDRRELPWGYQRSQIAPQGSAPPAYVYVYGTPQTPTDAAPLVQSYIDVMIDGCLQQSEAFARRFIETTEGWDAPWLNDRAAPRYIRPLMASASRHGEIDAVLADVLGSERLARRRELA